MGTIQQRDTRKDPNPFRVIGVLSPPKKLQKELLRDQLTLPDLYVRDTLKIGSL